MNRKQLKKKVEIGMKHVIRNEVDVWEGKQLMRGRKSISGMKRIVKIAEVDECDENKM